MAAKKKEVKTEEKKFQEFKFDGDIFSYSGRIYNPSEGKGKVLRRYYISLTLNDVMTINGIYLVETEDKFFLDWPSYESKKEEKYRSYFFLKKEYLEGEIDQLIDVLQAML